MKSKLLVIGIALALSLFLVSGCVGGAPEVEAPETNGETEEETGGTTGGTAGTDWCDTGDEWSYSGTATGGEATGSGEVKGITTYDGDQMCHAVHEWTTSEGQTMKIDYYYTEDKDKTCSVVTNADTGMEMYSQCETS